MAETFEDRLYALIADIEGDGPQYIERFKAKGDDAFVYGDLSDDADPESLDDDLMKLLVEFGLPLPWGGTNVTQAIFFSKGYWRLRDVTVGELKRAVVSGEWPVGAWSYHKDTWRDHLIATVMVPVSLVAGIILLPIFVCIAGGWWLFNRVFRKPA